MGQLGYRTVVLDCAIPPIDKACGEGLLPDSLKALAALGVDGLLATGMSLRGIRFTDGHSSVTAKFRNAPGVGLRRTTLHNLLMRRAEELGTVLCWNAKNVHLVPGGVSSNGRLVKSGLVIAADGQNSLLRREAKLDKPIHYERRYGFRRHYRLSPWSSYVELHWGRNSQLYITPVSPEEIGVALISRDPSLRLDRALEEFPEIRSRLRGAAPASSEKGSLSVSRTLRQVSKEGFALLGDASGSVDALTGEGIGLSFRQSLALADALRAGDLKRYEAEHRKLCRRPRMMAALMLLLDKHAGIQRRALASLAARPSVLEALLAIHVGEGGFRDLLSWQTLDFCRAFLMV